MEQESEELEESFSLGKGVRISTELAAAFLGREDDMVFEYLKGCHHSVGYPYGYLICYFTHHYEFMSERRLRNILKTLVVHGLVEKHSPIIGYNFYRVKKG